MLRDSTLAAAVARILQRSERQQDSQKIIDTFVDVGVIPQLENNNHQILYGRRGTGKTHVLKFLENSLLKNRSHCVKYLDARTLGSSSQFSNSNIPLHERCLALFKDILTETHDALLNHIFENSDAVGEIKSEDALSSLQEFSNTFSLPFESLKRESISKSTSIQNNNKVSAEISANKEALGASISGKMHGSKTNVVKEDFKIISEDKIIFPDINYLLEKILTDTKAQMHLIIDEWASIPFDLQPYLAEFLKRAFLPSPKITVKLASLEYRSAFNKVGTNNQFIGFEMGGDISSSIDLDDYYVYDRSPETVINTFEEMLFKHIRSELPQDYLYSHFSIDTGKKLIPRIFTKKDVFKELVRASEGVARDFINIFTTAFYYSKTKKNYSIDKQSVLDAARQWYEKDKASNLSDGLNAVLRIIVDDVIGKRRARSFLLPKELEKHPAIQKLFDFRVLHLMHRAYSDKDNPGVRYNIYSLDYGTFIDLIRTSKEPDVYLKSSTEYSEDDDIVPLDDKRSIRRIVVNAEILGNPDDF